MCFSQKYQILRRAVLKVANELDSHVLDMNFYWQELPNESIDIGICTTSVFRADRATSQRIGDGQ